jgi:hypothetical protein
MKHLFINMMLKNTLFLLFPCLWWIEKGKQLDFEKGGNIFFIVMYEKENIIVSLFELVITVVP